MGLAAEVLARDCEGEFTATNLQAWHDGRGAGLSFLRTWICECYWTVHSALMVWRRFTSITTQHARESSRRTPYALKPAIYIFIGMIHHFPNLITDRLGAKALASEHMGAEQDGRMVVNPCVLLRHRKRTWSHFLATRAMQTRSRAEGLPRSAGLCVVVVQAAKHSSSTKSVPSFVFVPASSGCLTKSRDWTGEILPATCTHSWRCVT